jgi:hypothetical protein
MHSAACDIGSGHAVTPGPRAFLPTTLGLRLTGGPLFSTAIGRVLRRIGALLYRRRRAVMEVHVVSLLVLHRSRASCQLAGGLFSPQRRLHFPARSDPGRRDLQEPRTELADFGSNQRRAAMGSARSPPPDRGIGAVDCGDLREGGGSSRHIRHPRLNSRRISPRLAVGPVNANRTALASSCHSSRCFMRSASRASAAAIRALNSPITSSFAARSAVASPFCAGS